MSRVQLAINVTDLDRAVAFYSRLFGAAPAKVKPGYANFAIADPPLKLVLFEGPEGATINHLGVEVETAEEVAAAERRLRGAGLETTGVEDTVCCHAEKTETWLADPDGARWEWYVKSGDADQLRKTVAGRPSEAPGGAPAACCHPAAGPDDAGPRPAEAPDGAPAACCS